MIVLLLVVAGPAFVLVAIVGAVVYLVVRYIKEWRLRRIGMVCPKCGERRLHKRYLARPDPIRKDAKYRLAPRPDFYLCDYCHARLKKSYKGPWEDASGAEYEKHYHPETSVDDPKKIRKG